MAGELPTIKYRGTTQLGSDVMPALSKNEVVSFVAGPKVMREFFSTAGFCHTMRRVTSEMPHVELAVPPGAYGNRQHLAIWRPIVEHDNEREASRNRADR